jgi:capsule biosynthesis phosphatase
MIPRDPCIVMDVDGTLCPIKGSADSYADLQPYRLMVDRLRELRAAGYYVILQTSRNMRSYEGNVGLINARSGGGTGN